MNKPTNDSRGVPGAPVPSFINEDAPSGPGPEPSLAMRLERAIMSDAFQTEEPPFDGDTRPDRTSQNATATRLEPINPAPPVTTIMLPSSA